MPAGICGGWVGNLRNCVTYRSLLALRQSRNQEFLHAILYDDWDKGLSVPVPLQVDSVVKKPPVS